MQIYRELTQIRGVAEVDNASVLSGQEFNIGDKWSTNLSNIRGNEWHAEVENMGSIAEGANGIIYLVNVKFGTKDRIKERVMIYKYYKVPRKAKEIFSKYKILRQKGLSVFPTFRLDEEEKGIFMTDVSVNGKVCLSANGCLGEGKNTTLEKFGFNRLNKINNFRGLVSSLFDEAVKAGEFGVYLDNHAWFFISNQEDLTKWNFIIADLDRVIINYNQDCVHRNLENAYDAINEFVIDNVVQENRQVYEGLLNSEYLQRVVG